MNFVVYEVNNPANGKKYIGKTNDLERRKGYHRWFSKKSNYAFYRAIRKYGFDTFQWNVLSKHRVEARAVDAEIRWIKQHRADGVTLYNMTDGGEGVKGWVPTKAQRKAISDGLTGIKRTPEQNAANSERQKGRVVSAATREKLSKIHKGRQHTDAQNQAHSKKMKGRKISAETREKISAKMSKTSKYPGVCWIDRNGGFWLAQKSYQGKHHYLGCFTTEKAAANAYKNFTVR